MSLELYCLERQADRIGFVAVGAAPRIVECCVVVETLCKSAQILSVLLYKYQKWNGTVEHEGDLRDMIGNVDDFKVLPSCS
jgi:hypothetical protein